MNQNIIDEEQLLDTKSYIYHENEVEFERVYRVFFSNPYNPQAEREKVLDELKKEVKSLRESRRTISSVEADIRANEREKVLDEFLNKQREEATVQDDTDCPYHRCVLCEIREELRQESKDGEP